MTDITLKTFLTTCGWDDAQRAPLAGDASFRRYERLTRDNGDTAVLMIAPPRHGEDTRPFAAVARFLIDAGFSAPRLFAQDHASGLILLEDLGDDLFARVVETAPQNEAEMYRSAVDVLIDLHKKKPAKSLGAYGVETLCHLAGLPVEWYGAQAAYLAELDTLLRATDGLTEVVTLRDYHAENLIWLPKRAGVARVGLLDFQDAARGHAAYDLVSLLEDARRDVPDAIRTEMIRRYVTITRTEPTAFARAFAVLGTQRNLRILGVFARLSKRDGKPRYIDFIPRVWSHLMRDLSHPDLKALRAAILRDIPEPTPDHLAGLME